MNRKAADGIGLAVTCALEAEPLLEFCFCPMVPRPEQGREPRVDLFGHDLGFARPVNCNVEFIRKSSDLVTRGRKPAVKVSEGPWTMGSLNAGGLLCTLTFPWTC